MAALPNNPNRNDEIVDQDRQPTEGMYIWMMLINAYFENGFTGTITTAALTGGGAQGSMTFQNGVLVSQVQAT